MSTELSGDVIADPIRLFLSTSALFLIIGGLAILVLIVGLFFVQGLVPASQVEPLPAGKGKRRLRPMGSTSPVAPTIPAPGSMNYRLWRRRVEDQTPAPRIDIALDRIVAEGLGEPRILRRMSNGFQIRLLDCNECTTQSGAASCHGSRDRLWEACRAVFGGEARVQEIACRHEGHVGCDFEVAV